MVSAVGQALGTALMPGGADDVLHIGIHDPLQGGLGDGLEEIAIVALLHDLQKAHGVVGHRGLRGQARSRKLDLDRNNPGDHPPAPRAAALRYARAPRAGSLTEIPPLQWALLAVLATSIARWNVGDSQPAPDVGGKDPIERLRRLLVKCRDEAPPAAPDLPFIAQADIRLGIEDRIRAAWVDFNAQEWMGATVFAAAALEAILLWGIKQANVASPAKKSFDELHLADLIKLAVAHRLIDAATCQQAELAKDARNLIHPGKALRSGEACSKTTALTAFAAVHRVIDVFANKS